MMDTHNDKSEGVKEIKEIRGRRLCPGFRGEVIKFETLKKRVWLWYDLEGKEFACPGGEVLMSLDEKVFEMIGDVEIGEDKREGVERVLRVMDDKYSRDENQDKFDIIKRYFCIKKEKKGINEGVH